MEKQIQFIGKWMVAAFIMTACAPNTLTAQPGMPTATPTTVAVSAAPANTASIRGVVWHDECMLAGGEGGVPIQPSAGCVSLGAGYQANGLREADEPGLGDVLVSLGYGTCSATDDYYEVRTKADGSYTFQDLAAGAYCVLVDALRPENSTLLPGQWTLPVGFINSGLARFDVTLAEGGQRTDVNFGWDYQFK